MIETFSNSLKRKALEKHRALLSIHRIMDMVMIYLAPVDREIMLIYLGDKLQGYKAVIDRLNLSPEVVSYHVKKSFRELEQIAQQKI